MKVILEGPDGVGKSTLANYLNQKYNLNILHSSSETSNTLDYHMGLVEFDGVVLDRANLGEIVYPEVYNREPKMTWDEQIDFMNSCNSDDIIYIIFYASNFDDLKERLFKRGDTEQVLKNAEKINLVFKTLAKMLSEFYSNVYALDISKDKDQIAYFKNILKERENDTNK